MGMTETGVIYSATITTAQRGEIHPMNERQKEILRILLSDSNQYVSTQHLADVIGCSEKTIRNDLKVIESDLLQHTNAYLEKKPGTGVTLHIHEGEREKLYQRLYSTTRLIDSQEDRLMEMAYELLLGTSHVTLQSLANRYYMPKSVLKKELHQLEQWLEKYGLRLVLRKKLGLIIDGSERNKRAAAANLCELAGSFTNRSFVKKQFPAHEVSVIENVLSEIEVPHHMTWIDETRESLLVHTLIALKRIKMNKPIGPVSNKDGIQKTDEYAWMVGFVKRLEPYFALRFPEEEITLLTIHLLSAKLRYSPSKEVGILFENEQSIHFIVQSLIDCMSRLTGIEFALDNELKEGLFLHSAAAFHRLIHGLPISNPMVSEIKKAYPYMFDRVIAAVTELNSQLPYKIPEEEAAYLALHFQVSYERLKKVNAQHQHGLIVCQLGIGMSQLIQTKLESHFRDLHIVGSVRKEEVDRYVQQQRIDLIISTAPLTTSGVPVIVISPLLPKSDLKKVERFLKYRYDQDPKTDQLALFSFLQSGVIVLQLEKEHRYEVIEELASALNQFGYVEEQYIHSAIIREKTAATTIGSGMAIPHGDPRFIRQSSIAVATLKQPLDWGGESVQLVFLLAVKEKRGSTKQLFRELSWLSEHPDMVQKLVKETTREQWLKVLHLCLKAMD